MVACSTNFSDFFLIYYNVFFLINMWQCWITMRLKESLNSKFLPQVGRAGITWMPSNWTQIALWLVGCWALDRMWIVSPWANPTSERYTYNQRYHYAHLGTSMGMSNDHWLNERFGAPLIVLNLREADWNPWSKQDLIHSKTCNNFIYLFSLSFHGTFLWYYPS